MERIKPILQRDSGAFATWIKEFKNVAIDKGLTTYYGIFEGVTTIQTQRMGIDLAKKIASEEGIEGLSTKEIKAYNDYTHDLVKYQEKYLQAQQLLKTCIEPDLYLNATRGKGV